MWLETFVLLSIARYLVFLELVAAAITLIILFRRRSRPVLAQWAISAGITIVLSLLFMQLGATLYYHPAPLQMYHDYPRTYSLPPPPNSFPSHHALLAGLVLALVFLGRPTWSILFAVASAIADATLIVVHSHYPIDVVGSTVFVGSATVLAVWAGPAVLRWQLLCGQRPLSRVTQQVSEILGRGIDLLLPSRSRE